MRCSRRNFIKKTVLLSLSALLPFRFSEASVLDVGKMVNLINFGCIDCRFDGFCVDCCPPDVAPRITYWLPHGFIETGSAFEIGKSASAFSYLRNFLNPLAKAIPVPTGSKTLGELRGDEVYMKLYPHFIGFPVQGLNKLMTTIGGISRGNASCICNLTDMFTFHSPLNVDNALDNLWSVVDKINSVKNKISDGKILSSLNQFQNKVSQIQNLYQSLLPEIPFLLSEMFFPIWIIDLLSPDAYTIAPLLNSIHKLTTNLSLPLGALACPYLTEKYGRYLQIPMGIDSSFVCVGHWGYGYPRTGIVKHSDPIIAGLLSIARFHHLFSKTIPILNIRFSYSNVKYQMYNPEKTGCFKAGYYSSDKSLQFLNPENFKKAIKNPSSFKNKLPNFNLPKSIFSLQTDRYRNVGVVVWKKHKKCCW